MTDKYRRGRTRRRLPQCLTGRAVRLARSVVADRARCPRVLGHGPSMEGSRYAVIWSNGDTEPVRVGKLELRDEFVTPHEEQNDARCENKSTPPISRRFEGSDLAPYLPEDRPKL
jgi:hypothetical protein